MKVIVDTCVWYPALCRNAIIDDPYVYELRELIREARIHRIQMIGPVRQEILSGVRSEKQFKQLKNHLSYFPDLVLKTEIYERAAEICNINRKKGIQGSNTDFLICAVSEIYGMPIFTTDKDFLNFEKQMSINLHVPGHT